MAHSYSETPRYKIDYFFRGKLRQATVAVVNAAGGPYYWFAFPKRTPTYFNKDKRGQWEPLTGRAAEGIPNGLFEVLTAAIDEQIINK